MMYLVEISYYGAKRCYQIITPSMGSKGPRIPKDFQPKIMNPQGQKQEYRSPKEQSKEEERKIGGMLFYPSRQNKGTNRCLSCFFIEFENL